MSLLPSTAFPFTPRQVNVLDSCIAFIDEGPNRGLPVVLLHGNPTWSYLWRKVIPVLSMGHRVIAPDLIGHGRSGRPDIDYRLRDHLAYFDHFMDAMSITDAVLVLHDWGGSIGLDWARRNPTRVRALVITETRVRTYATWEDVAPSARQRFRLLRDPEAGWELATHGDVFFRETIPQGIPGLTREEIEAYRAPHLSAASKRPLWRWVNELPIGGDPRDVVDVVDRYMDWLRTSDKPTLLVTVTPGAIVDEPTAQSLERIPTLTRVHLGPGGHFIPDHHGVSLANTIDRWLRMSQTSGERARPRG